MVVFANCPHRNDVSEALEKKNLESLTFEIDDIRGCAECKENCICDLWVSAYLVLDLSSQMDLEKQNCTIDTIQSITQKIANALVSKSNT